MPNDSEWTAAFNERVAALQSGGYSRDEAEKLAREQREAQRRSGRGPHGIPPSR
jgi:hypothetical protein